MFKAKYLYNNLLPVHTNDTNKININNNNVIVVFKLSLPDHP